MKKRIYLSLATLSTVALIGCSSSTTDDPKNDPNVQGNVKYAIEAVNLTPLKTTKHGDYNATNVGIVLKKTIMNEAGDQGLEQDATLEEVNQLDVAVNCGTEAHEVTLAQEFVVDKTSKNIAFNLGTYADPNNCKVLVEGKVNGVEVDRVESDIISKKAEDYAEATTVTVTPATPEGGKYLNGVLDVTKPKDGAAKQTYKVEANGAGTIEVDPKNQTVKFTAGEKIEGLTIAKKAGADGDKLNNIFAADGDGFTLDLTQESLKDEIKGGKIEVKKEPGLNATDITVNIAVDKGSSPEQPQLNIKQETLQNIADNSPAVVVKLTGVPAEVTDLDCGQVGADGRKAKVYDVKKSEEGQFLVGVETSKLTSKNAENTATCKGTGLPEEGFTVDFTEAKKALKPVIALYDVSSSDKPLDLSNFTNGQVKKVKAKLYPDLKHYANADALTESNSNLPGVTHVVTAKKDLSAVEATVIAVNADKNAEAGTITANNIECTTEKLGQETGCEFALKGVAAGDASLVFNGAADNPQKNNKYSFNITIK